MDNTFFEQLRLEQKLFWNWQKLKLQYGYPKLYYSLMIAYTWLKIQKMKLLIYLTLGSVKHMHKKNIRMQRYILFLHFLNKFAISTNLAKK